MMRRLSHESREEPDRPISALQHDTAVVVIAYGAQDPLLRCIESIAGQRNAKAARLIVVDNNPPEARCDPVRLRDVAGGKIHLQTLVPSTNLGYGRAVNFALEGIQEEFVLVSNPDLVLDPDLIDRLREVIRAQPNVAAVGPLLLSDRGETPAAMPTHPPGLRDEIASLTGLDRIFRPRDRHLSSDRTNGSVGFLSGACFLARRQALAAVGGFDPRFFLYYEDADLFLRLRTAGWGLRVVPDAVVRHTHGGTWTDPVLRQTASIRSAILYHRKHSGKTAELLYRAGLLLLYAPRILPGGLILALLGREPTFTMHDRFRMLGRTIRVALSPTRSDPAVERPRRVDRP